MEVKKKIIIKNNQSCGELCLHVYMVYYGYYKLQFFFCCNIILIMMLAQHDGAIIYIFFYFHLFYNTQQLSEHNIFYIQRFKYL